MASGQVIKHKMLAHDGTIFHLTEDPEGSVGVGFRATDAIEETIADGTDGTGNAAVDLGANFKVIGVVCEDCQFIQAATDMNAGVAFDPNGALCDLYEQDDPSTLWDPGAIPATGTMAFILTHAFGARKIRFTLSLPASGGDVVLRIFGFHSGG